MGEKSAPAYNGARFDSSGLCIAHPDVRLSRPIADGKYKIVRKICFKCGSASLMTGHRAQRTEKKKMYGNGKTVPDGLLVACDTKRSNGNTRKQSRRDIQDTTAVRVDRRDVSSGLLVADDSRRSNGRSHTHKKKGRVSQDLPTVRAARHDVRSELITAGDSRRSQSHTNEHERRNGQNHPAARAEPQIENSKGSRSKRSYSPNHKGDSRRRGRTLSPLRKSLQNNPNRPSSSTEVAKKKVTDAKIKEMMTLMPPLYKPSTKSGSRGSRGAKESRTSRPWQSGKQKLPFDGNGHCRAHPEVRLAEKKEGEWQIVSGVCPQCCVSAVLACQQDQALTIDAPVRDDSNSKDSTKNSDADELIGKLLKWTGGDSRNTDQNETKGCDDSQQTQPTSTSSSYPSTPESRKPAFSASYFTSGNRNIIGLALDLFQGEQIIAELNDFSISEATVKHKNVLCERATSPKEPPGRRL